MEIYSNKKLANLLAIAVVVLIAGNLRSPITALSPILDEVSTAFQLSPFQGSLLTAIPLAVFAACSILVSRASAKIDIRTSLLLSTAILFTGLYLRIHGLISTLYIGSLLIGLGICIGNVIMPAYIKRVFPTQIGLMTGIFSVALNTVAALASGITIAVGQWTGAGWRGSLGIRMIGALVALIVVAMDRYCQGASATKQPVPARSKQPDFNIFRSKQAWNISLLLAMQAFNYYCLVAYLPTILRDYGVEKSEAAWIFSIFQLAMLPTMLVGPVLASKLKNAQIMAFLMGTVYIAGIALLLLFGADYRYLSAILMGLAAGLAFSLSLLYISIRSRTVLTAVKLSGKAQSTGYLIAAAGPVLFSKLHSYDLSWKYPLMSLIVIALLLTMFTVYASKRRFVEDH